MEALIANALDQAGIKYESSKPVGNRSLDFYLPDADLYIEVKRMFAERVTKQMALVDNVIVAQGEKAVMALAALITNMEPPIE